MKIMHLKIASISLVACLCLMGCGHPEADNDPEAARTALDIWAVLESGQPKEITQTLIAESPTADQFERLRYSFRDDSSFGTLSLSGSTLDFNEAVVMWGMSLEDQALDPDINKNELIQAVEVLQSLLRGVLLSDIPHRDLADRYALTLSLTLGLEGTKVDLAQTDQQAEKYAANLELLGDDFNANIDKRGWKLPADRLP